MLSLCQLHRPITCLCTPGSMSLTRVLTVLNGAISRLGRNLVFGRSPSQAVERSPDDECAGDPTPPNAEQNYIIPPRVFKYPFRLALFHPYTQARCTEDFVIRRQLGRPPPQLEVINWRTLSPMNCMCLISQVWVFLYCIVLVYRILHVHVDQTKYMHIFCHKGLSFEDKGTSFQLLPTALSAPKTNG